MTYSSAIFEDLDGDLGTARASTPGSLDVSSGTKVSFQDAHNAPSTETDPLYEGQMRKYDHLIKKADIRPGHRVRHSIGAFSLPSVLTVIVAFSGLGDRFRLGCFCHSLRADNTWNHHRYYYTIQQSTRTGERANQGGWVRG